MYMVYTALYSLTSAVLAATLAVLGQLAALLSRLLARAPQAALGGVGLAQRHERARERLLPVGLEVGQDRRGLAVLVPRVALAPRLLGEMEFDFGTETES